MIRRTVPLLVACALAGSCGNSTGGELISIPFLVGGCNVCTSNNIARTDPTEPFTFTNQMGWTVTLTQAFVDLGPFYFNAYAPNSTQLMSGTITMEVSSQVVINALDPTLFEVDGGVAGETGSVVAVQIGLLSPDDTQPPGLSNLINGNGNGGVGFVAGTATYGATTVEFSGQILIAQALASAAMPLPWWQRVPGAYAMLDFTPQEQTLEMRVDPTHWFDNIEFNSAELGTPASPAPGPYDAGSPCLTKNGGCEANATCSDIDDGGVSCSCKAGYASTDGGTCILDGTNWTVGSTVNQNLAQGLETSASTYMFTLVPGDVPPETPMIYANIPDGGI